MYRKNPVCTSGHPMFAHKISVNKGIFVACVKKIKNGLWIAVIKHRKLFFYTSRKKCHFSSKLGAHTYSVRIYTRDFFSNFFNFLKYVFRQWVHINLWGKVIFLPFSALFTFVGRVPHVICTVLVGPVCKRRPSLVNKSIFGQTDATTDT